MTDRGRLIELIVDIENQICQAYPYTTDSFRIGEVADYLLQNGVIVPPCKVGQTVWFIRNGKIIETEVEKIVLKSKGLYLKLGCNAMYETSCNSIGKTVFLTPEEAEKALAERQNNCMIVQYVEDCTDCGFCQK